MAPIVNLGKVELEKLLKKRREGAAIGNDDVHAAFQNYISRLEPLAASLHLGSTQQLWWSPFVTPSGDPRSQLDAMWSAAQPLLSELVAHLKSRSAAAGGDRSLGSLVLECAAQDNCSSLVQRALPYPDISGALADLLREKRMSSESLARLANEFMRLLELPAAPVDLWQKSEFGAAGECASYVDTEKVRLCAGSDVAGLRAALALMTESEYRRAVAVQPPPFRTPAFPGFERALSSCVELLSLQPSVVQQLVYGYGSGLASLQPVSLYLARGARPSGQADPVCQGDIGCQQAANALMEAAITQLLPIGYHMASLRWLEGALASPTAGSDAAWRAHLRAALVV
ncbi:uncharacterized protein LOC119103232 [Pollicipes pollicipes]|uniref:uncharacterized protein LOC119103232 n=1 Tax=Pollicipes pollicipes TaxID=41117 RepID=UPI001884F0B9|nr:uncharacterized protein LOC119103232 [Pollicipes pollicipes]